MKMFVIKGGEITNNNKMSVDYISG